MRVNRVYDRLTIQGEGAHAGRRCTFVRLYGCNLHCVWCDSSETWDTKGRNGIEYPYRANSRTATPHEVAAEIMPLDVDLVVVTGGEPLLQRDELAELARLLRGRGIDTHVETNGTLSPGTELAHWIDYFTVSPKLPSADAGDAINVPVLAGFARLGWRNAGFKIVVADRDELVEARKLYDEINADRQARWVMPEGIDHDTVEHRMVELTEYALDLGLSVTGRQHVALWGSERGR